MTKLITILIALLCLILVLVSERASTTDREPSTAPVIAFVLACATAAALLGWLRAADNARHARRLRERQRHRGLAAHRVPDEGDRRQLQVADQLLDVLGGNRAAIDASRLAGWSRGHCCRGKHPGSNNYRSL